MGHEGIQHLEGEGWNAVQVLSRIEFVSFKLFIGGRSTQDCTWMDPNLLCQDYEMDFSMSVSHLVILSKSSTYQSSWSFFSPLYNNWSFIDLFLLSEVGSAATTWQLLGNVSAGSLEHTIYIAKLSAQLTLFLYLIFLEDISFNSSNSRGMTWDNWELRCENLFLGSECSHEHPSRR